MSEMKCPECGMGLFKTPKGNLVCEKCSYSHYSDVEDGNFSDPLKSKKKPKMGMAILAIVLFAILAWQCSMYFEAADKLKPALVNSLSSLLNSF